MEITAHNVAALFVDAKGIYPKLLTEHRCWDEAKDARRYVGELPVVAHPPCHLWTNMARVNFKRYGGEHNRPGNDGGCFGHALEAVRLWGGVLEHPAESHAWSHFRLQPPRSEGWLGGDPPGGYHDANFTEWVCEVWQSAYGHKARKRTWLLYCGARPPFELDWTRKPGTHQCGWFDRNKPTLGKREASATPERFARELIRLAEWSRGA
jgi:hypothetical protein